MNTVLKICSMAALALLPLCITGCSNREEGKNMFGIQQTVYFNAVVKNYMNRPIFEVFVNGKWVGAASEGGVGFNNGTVVGVPFNMGVQTVKWTLGGPEGTPRNGETVTAKNKIILDENTIPKNAQYIGIHIYPDDTAELTFSKGMPDQTERGLALVKDFPNDSK